MRKASLLECVQRHGTDAVSFQALESTMQHWSEEPVDGAAAPSDAGAAGAVAFADTGDAWVAVGAPLVDASRVPQVARAFVDSARERGRRACFFATETTGVDGFSRLLLGQQPVWEAKAWTETLRSHRRLREQIRRPKRKGVSVRRVDARELATGTPMRRAVEGLAGTWLASRRMVPMGFVVAVELFVFPEEHRYFVAEQGGPGGSVVAFLSAVPIYARRGWLVEDVLRGPRAPNGTTEALVDAVMRDVAAGDVVTLGLAPLSGPIAPWLRIARFASGALFDFRGLRAFRQRLRPARWEDVWLLYPRGEWIVPHLVSSLRAFAGGSLVRFALRSVARAPSGPPWALAVPLLPWTLLLAGLTLAGRADLVGFSTVALAFWVAFDALLVAQLLRSAMRPRPGRLVVSACAALVDAAISVSHLVVGGLGRTAVPIVLRSTATLAPCVGAIVLGWIAVQQVGDSSTRLRGSRGG